MDRTTNTSRTDIKTREGEAGYSLMSALVGAGLLAFAAVLVMNFNSASVGQEGRAKKRAESLRYAKILKGKITKIANYQVQESWDNLANISTTQRFYHLSPSNLKEAFEVRISTQCRPRSKELSKYEIKYSKALQSENAGYCIEAAACDPGESPFVSIVYEGEHGLRSEKKFVDGLYPRSPNNMVNEPFGMAACFFYDNNALHVSIDTAWASHVDRNNKVIHAKVVDNSVYVKRPALKNVQMVHKPAQ